MENKKIRQKINLLLSQKKRLLSYVTALALATASLTGCGEKEESTNDIVYQDDMFTYEYGEDGTVTMNGNISYDNFSALKMVRINNSKSEDEAFYICKYDYPIYQDIESNKIILSHDICSNKYYDEHSFDTYSVNEFLVEQEKVKNLYSIEDYQEIKSEMINSIKESKDMFTYEYGEDGTVTMKGSISYDNLSKLQMIGINNKENDESDKNFYICQRELGGYYLDIEHNEWILDEYNKDDDIYYNTYSVNEFLLKQEKVKNFYSVKDFQEIKSEMINSIKQSSTKKGK